MDLEGGTYANPIKKESWRTMLMLAYQSLGVVYGGLSTSPLYVYKNAFADIEHSETNEEIFGVLSFVFWTLTLVPLIKYVFIVLQANDNGEGGTFALYSLLCRRAGGGLLANGKLAEEDLSSFKKNEGLCHGHGSGSEEAAAKLKMLTEKNQLVRQALLGFALIGTCMTIGDGVLTPALSVFSAVSGLELSMAREHHKYLEVPIACLLLICLFAVQHHGTHRVGFLFAPIVITWLLCISMIGIYNIYYWNPHVYQALSPYFMYKFLKKTQRRGWMSLGGILLCITGSEAMFADLGHFSQLSIKIAFTSVVYPSLILAYMGQAAYLSRHHILESDYRIGFYVSVPEKLRWPVLAIAILAAVVGSQAVITGTFSIIKQCSAFGCFPRVKIVHTSSEFRGQIYIPDINWILMMLCLAVTIGFRDTKHLGNASGLAIITVMLVTTCLMSLVIFLLWNHGISISICFILLFGTMEALYFTASLVKFQEGAWVPIVLSCIFMIIMYTWHYGTLEKYKHDVQNKVSINWLLSLGPSLEIVRVRGIGLIQSELVCGIPAIFSHFVANLPAFHQVLVFLCIKSVPVPHVLTEERFLVRRIGPREHRIYRCIVRYGYHDIPKDDIEFENDLVCSIAAFIQSNDSFAESNEFSEEFVGDNEMVEDDCECLSSDEIQSPVPALKKKVKFVLAKGMKMDFETHEELRDLMEAREAGMAFIRGNSYVKAKSGSSFLKELAIDFYDFLRRNSRGPPHAMSIPYATSLDVGMVCLV